MKMTAGNGPLPCGSCNSPNWFGSPPYAMRVMVCDMAGNALTARAAKVLRVTRDIADLLYRVLNFLVRSVEMRRDADAGVGPVIDQYFAAREFFRDLLAIRHIEYNHAAAQVRLAAGAHGEAGSIGEVHEEVRLAE